MDLGITSEAKGEESREPVDSKAWGSSACLQEQAELGMQLTAPGTQ